MKMRIPLSITTAVLLATSAAGPVLAAPSPAPAPSATVAPTPATAATEPAATAPTTATPVTTTATETPSTAPSTAPTATSSPAPAETPAATSTPAEQPRQAAAAIVTRGAIGARYAADGGPNASYGQPITNEVCGQALNSCYQDFERGTLTWSPTTGTHLVTGAIQAKWKAAGGNNSPYGVPASDEIKQSGGQAVEQLFVAPGGKDGAMYWTPWGTGTHFVNFSGGIGGHWAKDGNFRDAARYGYPTSDETCGFAQNSCFQRFSAGTIVWTPTYGSVRIGGALRSKWEADGGMQAPYGVPISDETVFSNGAVAEQIFKSATGQTSGLYWSNWGTGTHRVNFAGAIGSFWADNGNFRAAGIDTPQRYGLPVGEETCSNGDCYQKFQYGVITWNAFGGGTTGMQAQKCQVFNDGRSKYSAQGANRVALALAPRYAQYRGDNVAAHGSFWSCKNVYGTYVLDWRTAAAYGENGFLAPWRQIKDFRTGKLLPPGVTGDTQSAYSPTGSYTFSNPFGIANPGSGFPGYHTVNSASRWGGDINTWYYNSYIENAGLGFPNENMWYFATRGDYRQGILINYNKSDDGTRTLNGEAGFAIMLHTIPYTSSVDRYQTWGCIAIAPERMSQFLREGRPGDRIVMGVESEVLR
ncbi:hypothetical protein VVR12_06525 [Rothia sp. LK2588]|uniref:hypothetical protein n=1 Tax=Rothia sp. LK2588 TaxID=3114369 RepID=UPI0034CE9EB5